MNDLSQWQQENEEYLSAALVWLRLRLEKLVVTGAPKSAPASSRGLFRKKLPAPKLRAPKDKLSTAAEAMQAACQIEPSPTLMLLSQRFGLSQFEQQILLLCTALDLDTRIAALCASAQDDPNRPYPTFALALALFDDPAWDALSPDRPLRYWRLLEINQPGSQPLTTSALRADERVVNYIKGLNYLDDRLAPLLAPLEGYDASVLPPSQRASVESITQQLEEANASGRPPVVQLLGADSQSKQLIAWHAASELGLNTFRLPAALLPTEATELETMARLWQRESMLLPLALYLDATELEGAASSPAQTALQRFLARSNGIFFLDTRETRPDIGRTSASVDITKPTPSEQRAAWTALVGSTAAESPSLLAGQFNLNLLTIQGIAQTNLNTAQNNGQALHDRLWQACLERTRPQLDTLAQRIDAKATWDDIVLPERDMKLLRQIAQQVGSRARVYEDWGFRQKMNRGLGISALFSGVSGTGKTMAAEVIANDLQLNLYRIDLSAVVSKYIGETEKNLRRLFDAAEDGGAIFLFFSMKPTRYLENVARSRTATTATPTLKSIICYSAWKPIAGWRSWRPI